MNIFKYCRYQYLFNILIMCLTINVVCSCGKEDIEIPDNEVAPPSEEENDSNDDFPEVGLAEFSNIEVTEVDFYGTTISAVIYSDGGDEISECGFCLSSTSKEPTVDDRKIPHESGSYVLSESISDFKEVATYYVRAYAVNSAGVAYSTAVSFVPDVIEGHQFVDLGLSVKWATCNVGANAPEEEGNQYAWGETSVKDDYTFSNYRYKRYAHIGNSYYNLYTLYGSIGGSQYDVATQNWGNFWSIPTPEIFEELISKCTWKLITINGVKGQRVTGPNGNSIFLPCNEYWSDKTVLSGDYGASRSDAYCLDVTDYGEGKSIRQSLAHYGNYIRPIAY